jgi:Uma2 family endonuclease
VISEIKPEADMALDPAYRKITADEFLAIDFGTDRRFELEDGVIVMMAGGGAAHAHVQMNISSYLRVVLRGSGCRPYGPDMGVRVSEFQVRYPDVSIYCDEPTKRDNDVLKAFDNPAAVFEVLSPSTTTKDQGQKLAEYRTLDSVQTIVFVDPENELTRIIQRLGPDSWRDDMFAQPHDVDLPSLNITIPHAEIFARD